MITINQYHQADHMAWDAYVHAHPQATLYHLSGWKNIIEKTYDHKTYYLIAKRQLNNPSNSTNSINSMSPSVGIGILPLVHMKHFLFGNTLISMPFLDIGGVLADDEQIEKSLISKAISIAHNLYANKIELRSTAPLSVLDSCDFKRSTRNSKLATRDWVSQTRSHKVRMLLKLPESSEILMKSFKSKLRSQIRKPIKKGLKSQIGGLELLDIFYDVFSVNMRDLGSPVHSKKLAQNVLQEFPENAKIVVVYEGEHPIACSLIVGFKDTLENPWASALREYGRFSPNMLLYWTMLEYACDNGYKYFDFGRSSPNDGTYKFKEQWGAKPAPLHWQYISLNGHQIDEETSEKSKFDKAIQYWKKIPIPVTKIIGPMIRKHIGL